MPRLTKFLPMQQLLIILAVFYALMALLFYFTGYSNSNTTFLGSAVRSFPFLYGGGSVFAFMAAWLTDIDQPRQRYLTLMALSGLPIFRATLYAAQGITEQSFEPLVGFLTFSLTAIILIRYTVEMMAHDNSRKLIEVYREELDKHEAAKKNGPDEL